MMAAMQHVPNPGLQLAKISSLPDHIPFFTTSLLVRSASAAVRMHKNSSLALYYIVVVISSLFGFLAR